MIEKHLSSQFDHDLNELCAKVLEMGGLVEQQILQAMKALDQWDTGLAEDVIRQEHSVNRLEIELDAECTNFIVLRQPTAVDLRLLMACSKTISNIERAGDEASKIAKRMKRLSDEGLARDINISEIKIAGQMAGNLFRRALDAFARLDIYESNSILREDTLLDNEFKSFVRKLVVYMMEDPRTIKIGLDFLFIAKAIERIGDHAKNISEYVIYIVQGTDVRHKKNDHHVVDLDE